MLIDAPLTRSCNADLPKKNAAGEPRTGRALVVKTRSRRAAGHVFSVSILIRFTTHFSARTGSDRWVSPVMRQIILTVL